MERLPENREAFDDNPIGKYISELESQLSDEGGDPYFKACYVAQLQALRENPHFVGIIKPYLLRNDEKTPSYHANHIARALQYPLMPRASALRYPYDWDVPEPWSQLIDRSSVPGTEERAGFEKSLSWPLASNVARRAFPIAILLGKMFKEGRVGDEVNILEVGYSQGQLLTKLALLHSGPKDHVALERPTAVKDRAQGLRVDYKYDSRGTRVIEKWVENCPEITGTGTDIQDTHDPEAIAWARSNTLRPKDLIDNGGLAAEAYDFIEMSKPERIRFHRADFSRLNRGDWKALRVEGGYDGVLFATVNNQIGPKKEKIFNENADSLVNGDGFVAELDFSVPDPTNPTQMLRYQHWFRRKHQYGLSVRRANDPDKEYHHVMTADTSRCERIVVNKLPLERFLMKRVVELRD